eukprot:1644687-Rhodomonas_salina.2
MRVLRRRSQSLTSQARARTHAAAHAPDNTTPSDARTSMFRPVPSVTPFLLMRSCTARMSHLTAPADRGDHAMSGTTSPSQRIVQDASDAGMCGIPSRLTKQTPQSEPDAYAHRLHRIALSIHTHSADIAAHILPYIAEHLRNPQIRHVRDSVTFKRSPAHLVLGVCVRVRVEQHLHHLGTPQARAQYPPGTTPHLRSEAREHTVTCPRQPSRSSRLGRKRTVTHIPVSGARCYVQCRALVCVCGVDLYKTRGIAQVRTRNRIVPKTWFLAFAFGVQHLSPRCAQQLISGCRNCISSGAATEFEPCCPRGASPQPPSPALRPGVPHRPRQYSARLCPSA